MGIHQIYTSNFMSSLFFKQAGIIFTISPVSITEPISPIDSGEFTETSANKIYI